MLNNLKVVIYGVSTKLKYIFFKDLKKQRQDLDNNTVVKSVVTDLKTSPPLSGISTQIKSSVVSNKEILYKKDQKIKYLDKLRKDKEFFKQQEYLKRVENNLKVAQNLLIKQKEIFNKNLSLKEAQIISLSNKLKGVSVLDPNIEKLNNIKIQISQMLFFNNFNKKVDIFPKEDILLHPDVVKLLAMAIIKGVFELHNSVDYSNNFNKFSFILFYETFDGSSHSLSFPTSLIITDNDIKYLIDFYMSPEKISFYNSVLEFVLHLTEKYEGTSFHKISVFGTSIKWNQLKNAFIDTNRYKNY